MRTYQDATVLFPVFDYLSTPETQMSDEDVDKVDDLMYESWVRCADEWEDDAPDAVLDRACDDFPF